MAAVTLQQLLGTASVTRAISRLKVPNSRMQQAIGMQIGGPHVTSPGGMSVSWDIMDATRTLSTGRPFGAGPATTAPQIIGQVTAAMWRTHEKILILESRVFRTRPLGRPHGTVDTRGQGYITKQEKYLAQRVRNTREFLVSRMMRGQFDVLMTGEDYILVDSGGTFTVNFQVPAGNLTTLNMTDLDGTSVHGAAILGGDWQTDATDIIGDLLQINAAFEVQHGRPLRHVWINSNEVENLFSNTGIVNAGGTANTIFNSFTPDATRSPDGVLDTGFTMVLRALPWLTFHIYDAGLVVNGTFTKFIPDNKAIFLPDWESDMGEWNEGSDIVAENLLDQGREVFGFHAWTTRVIDPPGWELKVIDVGIPGLYMPFSVAYGTISA